MIQRVKTVPVPIYGKQHSFRMSEDFIRGFVAGRGAGKTRIGAVDVCKRARDQEPWMVVSPDNSVIEETTWPTFRDVAEQLDVWIRGVKSPVRKCWIRTEDGGKAEIVFRSGEKPEKLRGPSKAGLWIDEASVMREDVYRLAIAVLRHRGRMGKCSMTFTPKGRQHWTFPCFYKRVTNPDRLRVLEGLRNAHGEGASALDGYEFFSGIPHRRRRSRFLVTARTLDNPFAPPEYYSLIRDAYSNLFALQELEGKFVDIQGMLFRREWFETVDAVPIEAARVRYWDRAATHGSGSYTAGVLMARTKGHFFVEDVIRGQWAPAERDEIITQKAHEDRRKYGNTVHIHVEQEGGSGGKEVAQDIVRKLVGFPVWADPVSRGHRFRMFENQQLPGQAKIDRASPMAAYAGSEFGNIKVLSASWNTDFFEELVAFPESTHSDQVDATSGAFNKLAALSLGWTGEIIRTSVEGPEPSEYGVQLVKDHNLRRRSPRK